MQEKQEVAADVQKSQLNSITINGEFNSANPILMTQQFVDSYKLHLGGKNKHEKVITESA